MTSEEYIRLAKIINNDPYLKHRALTCNACGNFSFVCEQCGTIRIPNNIYFKPLDLIAKRLTILKYSPQTFALCKLLFPEFSIEMLKYSYNDQK